MKYLSSYLSSFKCGTVLCGLILSAASAFSQGTAFTYQGRLANGGSPVTGVYDFTNALYNASSGGVQAGSTITLTAVPVTNGLFTVLLDFGGVFNGTTYWLQMGVRSNGVGSYVALSPRQQLTPTPYAITAENLDGTLLGSQLTGTLPSGLLSGLYGNAVTLNNAGNSFTGNGGGLTGLNASQLTSGTVLDARLSGNVALLNRTSQTFTGANIFDRGFGGPGRLIVTGSSNVDTTAFTGLGFQYHASSGEGAIMSSYDDGFGFLSFYTKSASGQPITRRMTIDTTGKVGIGTSSPATPLDVLGGNNWNLAASEGDFRIGDPTYRLKMGVATGGGGAGDSRIYASGGTSRLMLGSGTNDVLTVLGTGVGIGTINPSSSLHVVGDTRIEGVTRAGSEAGTGEAPDKGIITRRVRSTAAGIGSVVARTDKLTLERDGSFGGWRIVSVASPGNNTVAFTGLTSAGATVNFVMSLSAGPGTNTVFTDAQNVVSLRGSFGDSYFMNHMTEVSLTRYPGDSWWSGTLTSTFNQ